MFKNLLLVSLVLYSMIAISQVSTFQWAKKIGGVDADIGYSIKIDKYDNVYTVGTFKGNVDFDPGNPVFNLTSPGGAVFISKLDASGNFIWAKQINAFTIIGAALSIDTSGNSYIAGSFTGTIDIDPGPGIFTLTSSSGSADMFILKLNPSGDFVWAKKIGGIAAAVYPYAIKVDVTGSIYTTGSLEGNADFDPSGLSYNLASTGSTDIFVLKLNNVGDFSWAKRMGGPNWGDCGYGIELDKLGNVYSTGKFGLTVDFDPGPGINNLAASGYDDIYISKLDSNGNFVWAKRMGGSQNDKVYSIALDSLSNVLTTGTFQGFAYFNPQSGFSSINAVGNSDIFVSKLDSNGKYIWVKAIGGAAFETSMSIAVDRFSNIYVTGQFQSTVDFDPGTSVKNLTSLSGDDIFILKLDSAGNFRFANQLGVGGNTDAGYSIAIDSKNNIYTTGYFSLTFDFNLDTGIYNLVSSGGYDVFILKNGQCEPSTTPMFISSCKSYIFGDSVYTKSGLYYRVFRSSKGCDSAINLNLNIIPAVNDSVVQSGITLISKAINSTYQWVTCPNYVKIAGATSKNFTPSADGDYAVIVTQNGCKDTSFCYYVIGAGGIKNTFSNEFFNVNPNPTNGLLNIQMSRECKNVSVQIFNSLGNLLLTQSIMEAKSEIDLSGFANGLYILKTIGDDICPTTLKVFKQ